MAVGDILGCERGGESGVAGGCELWAVGGLASALPSRVLGGGRGKGDLWNWLVGEL